jgi:DNA processing protein
LILEQTGGVGLRKLRALVDVFGSATRALSVGRGEFIRVAGRGAHRRADREAVSNVEAGLRAADRLGMDVVSWASDRYPPRLLQLADPPPVLFLRGRSELLGREGLAVVGARKATARGKDVAERLGAGIARSGTSVVSGLALGIDGAAHRGALAVGGNTVAVLGRGADAVYPAAHRHLFRQLIDEGLAVSEFLPGTPPLPHHFPRRNRILAALASTVIVVEAGLKSGSLITVDHALDLGLDVWAVPGPIDAPTCEGSNRLLTDGARALVSVPDFLKELGGVEEQRVSAGRTQAPPESTLLAKLGEGPLHVDELAALAGLEVPEALARLTELELVGWVEQLPGMRFRKAA